MTTDTIDIETIGEDVPLLEGIRTTRSLRRSKPDRDLAQLGGTAELDLGASIEIERAVERVRLYAKIVARGRTFGPDQTVENLGRVGPHQ